MKPGCFFVLLLSLFLSGPIRAEDRPYAAWTDRDIKALSEQQIAGYLGGRGMGLALAAELNGYPGPKHVLELADPLEISDEQRASVMAIFDTMQSRAMALGRRIVDAESELDRLFAEGRIEPEGLVRLTAEIGELKGQLRASHLQAHLETRTLLSDRQVHRYRELRGYGSAHPSHGGAMHRH